MSRVEMNEPDGTHQTHKRLLNEIIATTHKLAVWEGLTDKQFTKELLEKIENSGFKIVRNETNVDRSSNI